MQEKKGSGNETLKKGKLFPPINNFHFSLLLVGFLFFLLRKRIIEVEKINRSNIL